MGQVNPTSSVATGRRRVVLLIAIVAAGFSVRLAYLVHAVHSPGFVWEDPDQYLTQALLLVRRGRWTWTFAAVTYLINGQRHALPPGYSVFLSIFALAPGFPLSAQVAQLLLSTVSIPLVYALGRQVHSAAAGLVAAAAFAVWVPNIVNVWSTSQETVYIPLILLAFLVLARAIDRDAKPSRFALAGLIFGAAALTRSMPLFFILPAAVVHAITGGDRRRSWRQAAALVAGFLILTVPYSIGLSRYFHAVTIIDTHGSIHLEAASDGHAPGLAATAQALARTIAANPIDYFSDCLWRARSLLQVNGGRILQIYVVASSQVTATVWKVLVHAGTDGLLLFGVLLAPIGAALCAGRRAALMLLVWTAVNIAVASAGGFGGARLRTPFEPLLYVLAAVTCVGAWRRIRIATAAVAAVVVCAAGAAVLPQVPQSLSAWPDYGMAWPSIFNRASGQFTGEAGLNVPAADGVARVSLIPGGTDPVRVDVRIRGIQVRTIELAPGAATPIHVLWPARGLAFLELAAADGAGSPATVRVLTE